MIYLIILALITFLLAFALKLLITYLFIKFFNRTNNFWSIFKPILLYELGVFCFFIINPGSLIYILTPIIPRIFLFPIYFLISIIILFLIFKFIMQKFSLLNFKKSLLVFLVMFIIITPIISYSKAKLEFNIEKKIPIEWPYRLGEFQGPGVLKPPPVILLEKINRLNDIFLEKEFLRELRYFLITI